MLIFLPEIIIIVLDSALTQFHQILTSLCNPKLKLDFVTIPDDEDFQGTADALRHIKDKIEVCVLISVWQVYRNSVFQDGLRQVISQFTGQCSKQFSWSG